MKIFKNTFLILAICMIFCPKSYGNTDNIALLTKNGFFDTGKPTLADTFSNPYEEVRKVMGQHLKYSNSYNFEKLKALYAPNYINADGIGYDISFDLVKKTWQSYPDIKYKMYITNVEVYGNSAIVETSESAVATTDAKSGLIAQKGLLQSNSASVYYLQKYGCDWKIISDHIVYEKTYLTYGSAKNIAIDLSSPSQIGADTPYTASLKIDVPKDTLVIASVGKENITYPQAVAEEVFRKLPQDGVLERMFKSNNQNINEYTVASFGLTKAEIKDGTNIKIYITGLGFAMSRVNVIPANNFIKVEKDEKAK